MKIKAVKKSKTEKEAEFLEKFYDHVYRSESVILHNRNPVFPFDRGNSLDQDDEDFLKSYENLRPFLKKYMRNDRFYSSPPGLLLRSGSYRAETGHQALMYFLIKPREYENPWVIQSDEYKIIKGEAQKELADRQMIIVNALERKRQSAQRNERKKNEQAVLLMVIREHMASESNNSKPLKWHEIAERLPENIGPWSQAKISRMLAKIFGGDNSKGMKAYGRFFMKGESPKDKAEFDPDHEDD